MTDPASTERKMFEAWIERRKGPTGDEPGYPGPRDMYTDEKWCALEGWMARAALSSTPQGGAAEKEAFLQSPAELERLHRSEMLLADAVLSRDDRIAELEKQLAASPALAEQPSTDALETALIAECERAMRQRDEYLRTGKSTAAHGGSHDTCFGFILRKHGLAAHPVRESPATEFCWLVELFEPNGGNSMGLYHTGFTTLGGDSRTTKDPHEAKRYPSKAQAAAVAADLLSKAGTWHAVEHGFDRGESPAVAAPQPMPMTKEWCRDYPGSAAYIINELARQVDASQGAPAP